MEKQPNRFLDQLSNLLVPKERTKQPETVTNERILKELIACFETSLERESFGTSLLFNAHYIIILHPDTYKERLAALPVIVNEAVKAFTERLKERKRPEDEVPPVSTHWYFKFGPGTEFAGRTIGPGDIDVIGSLSGAGFDSPRASENASLGNVKATRKVKNTNLYDKMDLSVGAFQHIDFREAGAFAIKMDTRLLNAEKPQSAAPAAPTGTIAHKTAHPSALARIDCYLADKDKEETYWMQDREVVVARMEADNQAFSNYLRLDSPYVSNPHARIRYNEAAQRFEIASFSRNETRVNEQVMTRSEPASPQWTELPRQAQILLNGIVTLSFQSNL
ncbi:FHA domain-containing protein [Spirosoma taeanense]|uniref:FHA domain-containing protein n=1 Tax=Spirosoma taeanense TaxID=2735870 RepID=A0A6M5YAM3_9BACT|nr:FHA domain-containing protein [Spirosoma taeanense]QJW90330.1 FHA domain-containing protein [Spirosoma taeanense]